MSGLIKKQKAFTLIELLIVIAIIGLLASVVMVSLNSARGKARDARRKADLSQVANALQLYFDANGTMLVAGTGYAGCGCGWLSYQGGVYTTSVSQGLVSAGFLGSIAIDPSGRTSGGTTGSTAYMIYMCAGNVGASLYASLENPSSSDTAAFNVACAGTGPSSYGMNYAVDVR